MPSIDDKNETEEEEMEQESADSDKSDEDDYESCSGSDIDESSGRPTLSLSKDLLAKYLNTQQTASA